MLTQHARAKAYRIEEERQERVLALADVYSDLVDSCETFLHGEHWRGRTLDPADRKRQRRACAEAMAVAAMRAWWESGGRDCDRDELWEACGVRMP